MSANASTHFRPRPIDINKPLLIMRGILTDVEGCVRGVPNMPTGMEPEEEEEAHIQEAITASLMLSSESGGLPEIPTPVVKVVEGYDTEIDPNPLVLSQTYIHYRDKAHADWDHIVEYDLCSEDETLLNTINSGGKKPILTEDKFEYIIDRFEKESEYHGNDFNVTRAELIMKPMKPTIVHTVYDHWRKKRQSRSNKALIPRFVKPPAWDDPSPYIAFRPREKDKEKLKKVRRNDPSSLAKMRALRLEMERSRTLLEMIKKRERLKRDQIALVSDLYTQLQSEMQRGEDDRSSIKKNKNATPTGALPGPSTAKPKLMPPPASRPRQDHFYTYATTSARVKITPQTCAPPYILDPPEVRKAAKAAQQASSSSAAPHLPPPIAFGTPPKNFLHISLDFDGDSVNDDDEESEEEEEDTEGEDDATALVVAELEQLDVDAYFPRKIDGHIALGRTKRPFRGRARVGRGGRVVIDHSFMYSLLPREEEEAKRRKLQNREANTIRHYYNHRHYEQVLNLNNPIPNDDVSMSEGESGGLSSADVDNTNTNNNNNNRDDINNSSTANDNDNIDNNSNINININADISNSDDVDNDNSYSNNDDNNIIIHSNTTEDSTSDVISSNKPQTFYPPSSPPPPTELDYDDPKPMDSSPHNNNHIMNNHNAHDSTSLSPLPPPTSPLPPTLTTSSSQSSEEGEDDFKYTPTCIEKTSNTTTTTPPVTHTTYAKKQKRKLDTSSPQVM